MLKTLKYFFSSNVKNVKGTLRSCFFIIVYFFFLIVNRVTRYNLKGIGLNLKGIFY